MCRWNAGCSSENSFFSILWCQKNEEDCIKATQSAPLFFLGKGPPFLDHVRYEATLTMATFLLLQWADENNAGIISLVNLLMQTCISSLVFLFFFLISVRTVIGYHSALLVRVRL